MIGWAKRKIAKYFVKEYLTKVLKDDELLEAIADICVSLRDVKIKLEKYAHLFNEAEDVEYQDIDNVVQEKLQNLKENTDERRN